MSDPSLQTSSRALWVSATLHGSIVVIFGALSLARGCARPPKPREIITYLDPSVFAPPPAATLTPLQEIPPAPEPRPPAPQPPPRDIPEPRRTPPRPRIEPSTQRVVRAPTPRPPMPARPALTPEQIRDRLSCGLSAGPSAPARDEFPFGWYFSLVKQTMYEAWVQPSGLSASSGLTVQVLIRVERDGTITRRQMVKPSGHPLMDESVMRAVESVRKLRPLPEQYRGAYRDITIEFELTGVAG